MNLKELYKELAENGIPVPFIRDTQINKPSMTLTFAYVSFIVAMTGIIFLTIKEIVLGTTAAIMFWVLCMVFYRIRKLDKFKIDLDDKSIELDGGDEDESK